MVNNSVHSLFGTLATFALAALAHFFGKNHPDCIIVITVIFAILLGTIIPVVLCWHVRIRTNLVDYALWYMVMVLPVSFGLVTSQSLEIGVTVAGFYAFVLLLSVAVARIGVKIYSHRGLTKANKLAIGA